MSEQQILNLNDAMTFKDEHSEEKHGLHGHVSIYRRNKETGETSFWYEADNIIPISGYQWILMKMFGLHLDSDHHKSGQQYEKLDQDTTVVIPDLNNTGKLSIGTDPLGYSPMATDISESHICQGFMVGNGGAGEDQMTAKNTDYSFMCLRNPIPFQQVNGQLETSVIGKYCGKYRLDNSSINSYYIKRFEARPFITHSWWADGQRWDYVDPVTQDDLGPNSVNGAGKTNRIESYVECQLALDDTDCAAFFSNDGNTQTPAINELGLVAFDTTGTGTRTIMENLYETHIRPIINIIFDSSKHTVDDVKYMKDLISETVIAMEPILETVSDERINNMYALFSDINQDVYKRTVYKITGMSLVYDGDTPNLGGGFIEGWQSNLFRINWLPGVTSAGIFAVNSDATPSTRGEASASDTFVTWDSSTFKSVYPIINDRITWQNTSVEVGFESTDGDPSMFVGNFDVTMLQPLVLLPGEETADPEPPQGFKVHIGENDVQTIEIDHPWATYQEILSRGADDPEPNIGVEALYDRYNNYKRETDDYLDIIKSDEFSALTVDEAQRIKLITYYTFKAIPIQTNWEILINYRIYAN